MLTAEPLVASGVGQGSGHSSSRAFAPRPSARSSGSAARPHGALGVPSSASAPRAIPQRSARLQATSATTAARCSTSAPSAQAPQVVDFGYDRDLEARYDWGPELGKGGNGVVRVVVDKASGAEYACKAIAKVLAGDHSDAKKAGHVDSIRREVEVLRRLSGSLNIVRLVDVFEDEGSVYLVQELCKGGELWHRIGEKHYSERTVASFMRAVLRTLAQCHSHHILHRDIKPGNFMLLDDSERAPLKAIDFGLAVPFDPEQLPRRDLGLEGTPWYMAPEVLSSQVTPASDVWSAGVMAYQLLTGRLPFDDHRNPFAPSISAVWRSVLTDKVDFNMPWWQGISDEGKDFVHMLLNRDVDKRPSAKEALKHPWLKGNSSERSIGKQIDVSVVARIQRFAQNNRFKRSVLRMIAEELLARPGAMAAEAAAEAAEAAAASGRAQVAASPNSGNPIIHDPLSQQMQEIYRCLSLDARESVDRDAAALALSQMGYRLEPSEVNRLLEQVDTSNSGKVRRAALAASQIDWRYLQQAQMSDWLDIAARAFAALDTDSDGRLHVNEILASLRAKLPADELRRTIQQAMQDAGHEAGADYMDFEGFLRMLRVGSVDSLDQYDARWDRPASLGSIDRLQSLLDASHHGSDGGSTKGRGLYAGVATAGAAASHDAAAASAASGGVAAGGVDADKPWLKPMVNFKFDFGSEFMAHKVGAAAAAAAAQPAGPSGHGQQQPPETRGAPGAAADAAAAAAPPGPQAANAISASSYFNNGAVRGGGHFDRRMHGASLYRNAVVNPGPHGAKASPLFAAAGGAGQHLPTVKE